MTTKLFNEYENCSKNIALVLPNLIHFYLNMLRDFQSNCRSQSNYETFDQTGIENNVFLKEITV